MAKFRTPLRWVGIVLLVSISLFAGQKVKPHVYAGECVGCTDCVVACPVQHKGAISMVNGKAVIDPEVCIGCNICVTVCSFGAVKQ